MKVYLAGPWVDRQQFPSIAAKFEAAGHVVTERWWEKEDETGNHIDDTDSEYLEERALADFEGVVRADAMVLVNSKKSEGKAVETGIAAARFLPIVLIGSRSNVFHYLPNVYLVPDIDAAVELLS